MKSNARVYYVICEYIKGHRGPRPAYRLQSLPLSFHASDIATQIRSFIEVCGELYSTNKKEW